MQMPALRVRNLLAAGVLSVLIVGSMGAQAADRYVSTAGSDTANDCLSSATPCRTVGYALTQAASGDTVKVAEGTYQENFRVDYPTSLTLSGGWSREFTGRDPTTMVTVLNGAGSHVSVESGSGETIDLTLDGFVLANLPLGGVEATSLDDGLLSLTLRGCTLTGSLYGLTAVATGTSSLDLTITGSAITHNRAGGVRFVAVGSASANLVVSDSTLAGNSIRGGSGGGLIADGSSSVLMHVLVSNVTFDRNRVRYRYAGGQGGGLAVIGLVDAEVSASQVTRNKANNLGGGLWGEAHGVSITNSVFVQNAGAAIYLSRRAFTSPSSW